MTCSHTSREIRDPVCIIVRVLVCVFIYALGNRNLRCCIKCTCGVKMRKNLANVNIFSVVCLQFLTPTIVILICDLTFYASLRIVYFPFTYRHFQETNSR